MRGTNLAVTLEHKSPGEVIDSGAHTVEGEAVPMIRERLAQLYGSAQQLTVEEGHAGGFLVLVRIPFHLTSREQAAQLMEEPV